MNPFEYAARKIVYWVSWPLVLVLIRNSIRTRILVIVGKDVLVVRGWHVGKKWEIPGGGVHAGEKLKSAAARELYEEVGISILPSTLISLGSFEHSTSGMHYQIASFALVLPKKPPLTLQRLEVVDALWLQKTALTHTTVEPGVMEALARWKKHPRSATLGAGSKVKRDPT